MSNEKITINIPGAYDIVISRKGKSLIVRYGSDQTSADNYTKGAEAIGYAVMHALACEGHLPSGFDMEIVS